jgi:hypothetical protein
MNKVIIYRDDEGLIVVINPTPEALSLFGIEAIAQKDVPAGKPYKIIDAAIVPESREARTAWVVDDSSLTDGVGAEWSTFEVKP